MELQEKKKHKKIKAYRKSVYEKPTALGSDDSFSSSTSSWKPLRWVRLSLIFTMRDICINSNLDPLTKFSSSSRSTTFKNILHGTFSNDPKDHPCQHKNNQELCNEKEHSILHFKESQRKLRQQNDLNFPNERKPQQNKYLCQKKEINPKEQDWESHY